MISWVWLGVMMICKGIWLFKRRRLASPEDWHRNVNRTVLRVRRVRRSRRPDLTTLYRRPVAITASVCRGNRYYRCRWVEFVAQFVEESLEDILIKFNGFCLHELKIHIFNEVHETQHEVWAPPSFACESLKTPPGDGSTLRACLCLKKSRTELLWVLVELLDFDQVIDGRN